MAKRFEIINHTADVGIAAYGAELKEAFANAAYGLFSLMTDLDQVADSVSREVDVSAENQEDLLVAWLNELIYLFEVDGVLFKTFEVVELTDRRLRAMCRGEKTDPERHSIRTGVKAATYHMVEIAKRDGYRIQVLLDI